MYQERIHRVPARAGGHYQVPEINPRAVEILDRIGTKQNLEARIIWDARNLTLEELKAVSPQVKEALHRVGLDVGL